MSLNASRNLNLSGSRVFSLLAAHRIQTQPPCDLSNRLHLESISSARLSDLCFAIDQSESARIDAMRFISPESGLESEPVDIAFVSRLLVLNPFFVTRLVYLSALFRLCADQSIL